MTTREKILLDALAFYASGANWTSITEGGAFGIQYLVIDKSDRTQGSNRDYPDIDTAGRRAREALKAYEAASEPSVSEEEMELLADKASVGKKNFMDWEEGFIAGYRSALARIKGEK